MKQLKALATILLLAVCFIPFIVPRVGQVYGAYTRTTTQVTVNGTATLILAAATSGDGRSAIILSNNGTYIVYIGSSDVTILTGYALQPCGTVGSTIVLTQAMGFNVASAIYGITLNNHECVVFVLVDYTP